MDTLNLSLAILSEIKQALSKLNEQEAEKLVAMVLGARSIFIAGAGRSGFVMRAFANRLMHLGFSVRVVGECTAPAAEKGDILIIGSGSGETKSLAAVARKAKDLSLEIAVVTTNAGSSIAKLSDAAVSIMAASKGSADGGAKSFQPMGSLFEQCLFVFLDGVILRLMELTGKGSKEMSERHANLE